MSNVTSDMIRGLLATAMTNQGAADEVMDRLDGLVSTHENPKDIRTIPGFREATADVAIQQALNSYSTVVVPAGNYTITNTITIPSHRKLVINRGATLTLADDVNDAMITNSGADAGGNVDIHIVMNGILDGNSAGQSGAYTLQKTLRLDTIDQFTIVGTGLIRDGKYSGLMVSVATNGFVGGLKVTGTTAGDSIGLSVGSNSSYVTFADLTLTGHLGTAAGGGYGVYCQGAASVVPQTVHNLTFINVNSYNNDDDCMALLDVRDSQFYRCKFNNSVSDKGAHLQRIKGCLFEECEFNENALAGCSIDGSSEPDTLKFYRCKFNHNGDDGCEPNGDNMVFYDCDAIGNAQRGYRPYYGTPTNIVWKGGTIGNNGGPGILLDGPAAAGTAYSTIDGVYFFDSAGTQDYAVQDGANVGTGNIIRNCIILPQSTGAVSLTSTTESLGDLANVKH